MVRLLTRLVLLFAVVIILPTVLIFVFSHRSSGYIAAFSDKQALLARTPSPRIIFIGGSNIAFGLDSPIIEESLKIRTVNLGLHASLGLRFMLESVKPYLRPGDIVIVVPEYDLFWGTLVDGSNDGIMDELLSVDPGAVRYLTTWAQLRNILAGYPMWFKDRMKTALSHPLLVGIVWLGKHLGVSRATLAAGAAQPDAARPDSSGAGDPHPYGRDAFNAWGDDVGRNGPIRGHQDVPFYPVVGPEVNKSALSALNAFGQAALARGAHVLFAFPCYRQSFFEKESVRIEARMSEFEPRLEIPRLNQPVDVALPDSLFFDTRYHLNIEGKKLRTQMMIQELKLWLERPQS